MDSIIKYSIIAAISAASLPAGAKVYECNVGGVTVYTSRPSANCHTPDLPRIGSYTSIAPRAAPPPPPPPRPPPPPPPPPRREGALPPPPPRASPRRRANRLPRPQPLRHRRGAPP